MTNTQGTFVTPPEHQGQIVEISYAYHPPTDTVWMRRYDRSDGETSFRSAPCPDDVGVDVQNGAPDIDAAQWSEWQATCPKDWD